MAAPTPLAFVGNDDGGADEVGAIGVDLSDDVQIGASGALFWPMAR